MSMQRKSIWLMARVAAGAVAIALLASGCATQRQSAAARANPATAATDAAIDAAQLEQWADETFGRIIEEHRVSALAIAVTQGNRVILNKGYGYADWATKQPMKPDQTQFRIASLTKTFLATAVAQLLERGRIDSLDDPVNKYLKRS